MADSASLVCASFDNYYATGQKMAKAYVAGGPTEGNKLMAEFDQTAEKISSALDALEDNLTQISDQAGDNMLNAGHTAGLRLQEIQSIFFATGLLSIFVVLGAWAGIRWGVLKPLNSYTQETIQISQGNLTLKVAGIMRSDEIGVMSKALEGFRVGLIEAEFMRKEQELHKEETARAHAQERLDPKLRALLEQWNAAVNKEKSLGKGIELKPAVVLPFDARLANHRATPFGARPGADPPRP